jgi:hypothetical protein
MLRWAAIARSQAADEFVSRMPLTGDTWQDSDQRKMNIVEGVLTSEDALKPQDDPPASDRISMRKEHPLM